MTIDDVKKIIQEIEALKTDDESAHCKEDGLYFDFIKMISESDHPLSGMAKEIIKTKKIEFARWCA